MAISIRNKKVEELAREIARQKNISMTQAIIESLEKEKKRSRRVPGPEAARLAEIKGIGRRCAALPDIDPRPADDILGYNEKGTFR